MKEIAKRVLSIGGSLLWVGVMTYALLLFCLVLPDLLQGFAAYLDNRLADPEEPNRGVMQFFRNTYALVTMAGMIWVIVKLCRWLWTSPPRRAADYDPPDFDDVVARSVEMRETRQNRAKLLERE